MHPSSSRLTRGRHRGRRLLVATVSVLLLAACTGAGEAGPDAVSAPAGPVTPIPTTTPPAPGALEPSPPFDLARVVLEDPDGAAVSYEVYVASDQPMRRRGLMERSDLPARTGMVFLFGEDTDGGFWMRNTLIPLDIAFADAEGAVIAVLTMEPCSTDPCEVYAPGAPYRIALEANAGELSALGVGPGWTLVLPDGLPPPE